MHKSNHAYDRAASGKRGATVEERIIALREAHEEAAAKRLADVHVTIKNLWKTYRETTKRENDNLAAAIVKVTQNGR